MASRISLVLRFRAQLKGRSDLLLVTFEASGELSGINTVAQPLAAQLHGELTPQGLTGKRGRVWGRSPVPIDIQKESAVSFEVTVLSLVI